MNIKERWKSFLSICDKNSPTILAGISVVGVIATGYTAYKAAPKAHAILQKYHEDKLLIDKDDKETKKVVLKEAAKGLIPVMLPPILTGSATCACIIWGNKIGTKRLAVLSAAYTVADNRLKDYIRNSVETLGEARTQKVREAIAKKHAEEFTEDDISDVNMIVTGDGDVACVDYWSKQTFRSSVAKIDQVVNELSAELLELKDSRDEDFIDLSSLYERLGLKKTPYSDIHGWRYSDMTNGRLPIYCTSTLMDGKPFVVVEYDDLSIRNEYIFRNMDQ